MKFFKFIFVLLVFSTSPVNASTYIDNFDDLTTQYVSSGFATSISTSTVATNNALGGYRKINIEKTGALASAKVKDGKFYHSAGVGTSAKSTITWDANGTGLNANLLATDTLGFAGSSCYECFVLDIISIDQGNVDLTIQLNDGTNTYSHTSTGVDTGILEILFSQFNNNIDFSSIFSISLIVEGGIAGDMSLDFQGYTGKALALSNVNSVPLPASLWLFIPGLISFFGAHRHRK